MCLNHPHRIRVESWLDSTVSSKIESVVKCKLQFDTHMRIKIMPMFTGYNKDAVSTAFQGSIFFKINTLPIQL